MQGRFQELLGLSPGKAGYFHASWGAAEHVVGEHASNIGGHMNTSYCHLGPGNIHGLLCGMGHLLGW